MVAGKQYVCGHLLFSTIMCVNHVGVLFNNVNTVSGIFIVCSSWLPSPCKFFNYTYFIDFFID